MGFVFNTCDACTTNKSVKGKMHTVRFHLDNLMSSHVDEKVNNKFPVWPNQQCGEHGEVKATRGNAHDHLGMFFGSGMEKWRLTWLNMSRTS